MRPDEAALVEDEDVYREVRRGGLPTRHLRRRTGGWAARQLLETAARAGRWHPRSDPSLHSVEVIRNLSYAPAGPRQHSRTHQLDIYRPTDAAEPMPVVLYIHGGAFQSLSKDTHWMMSIGFARKGYLVVSINYRLAPRYKYPAALEDVARAYEWTLYHAAAYGGDPTRMIVAGESAGANLAAALTLMACFDRPEPFARDVFRTGVVPVACLPACGLLQVTDTDRYFRRRKMSRLVHDQIEGCESAYLDGAKIGPGGVELADPLVVMESPAEPVRPLPPFFALVGTRDPLLDDTRRLEKALTLRGVDVEARYYPNGPHAFHAVPVVPTARRAWADQYAFLGRVVPDAPGPDLRGVVIPEQAREFADHDQWFT
jgi:acetyl esterase